MITPYSKQQKLISNGRLMDGRCAPLADGVEIKTVDGFQGREKSVIVFDTVRCNKEARIGFLQVMP